ncbi:hypothetical protein Ctha_2213 [Chloroherpeton thalassium ATCC 35110]|uniref:Integrin alpha beta-propellor repeat protein n=1 Tax=Chloroherpeton thalassium (strain ATCC 35110 / GB-78) TaxID=517418 RepID=B3QW10_CHLT3|nr:FG-GAP repeat protein [Chloroherpeton thalassium]ACF14664.1 hypothetical protein Ctha_2213 [Chloroherpeton thalassium ATCC 35110]
MVFALLVLCGQSSAAYAQDWNEIIKVVASDAVAADYFGFAVSVSGDVAIVGAYGNDDDGDNSGSAYIFEKSGAAWPQTAKLTASDAVSGDKDGDNPLPVELSSFSGVSTETGIQLNWKTASETDNAGFVLYRNGSKTAISSGSFTETKKMMLLK